MTRLQLLTHIAAITPAVFLLVDFLNGNLTADPIQALTQRTGRTAILLLFLSLSCTPFRTLTGFAGVIRIRRALGLYSFFYIVLHFLVFAALDYRFSLGLIWLEYRDKPFLWIGVAALVIMTLLAVTSFSVWKRILRKGWKRLHRLVYLAGVLTVLHYGLAKKGDVFLLRGDIIGPLIYSCLVALLMFLRIKAVRLWIVKNRPRLAQVEKRISALPKFLDKPV